MATMIALIIAAFVAWFRHGNSIIHSNWTTRQPGSAAGIVHQIFDGVCLGMLGMTGFECEAYMLWIKCRHLNSGQVRRIT